MKRIILTTIILLFILTACMPDRPGRPNILKDTAGLIGSFFALEWLTGINPAISFIAFIRIIIFIITFFILFEILDHDPLKNKISRRAALLIAISISLMSTFFIPPSLLITIALMYATLFAVITAGIPTLISIWLAFSFTPQTKFGYALRAAIIVLAMILTGAITEFTENTLQQGNIREIVEIEKGQILPDTQLIRTLETLGYWTYYAQLILLIAFISNAIMAVFGKIPTYKPGIIEDIITGITGHDYTTPTTQQYTRTGQPIQEIQRQITNLPNIAQEDMPAYAQNIINKLEALEKKVAGQNPNAAAQIDKAVSEVKEIATQKTPVTPRQAGEVTTQLEQAIETATPTAPPPPTLTTPPQETTSATPAIQQAQQITQAILTTTQTDTSALKEVTQTTQNLSQAKVQTGATTIATGLTQLSQNIEESKTAITTAAKKSDAQTLKENISKNIQQLKKGLNAYNQWLNKSQTWCGETIQLLQTNSSELSKVFKKLNASNEERQTAYEQYSKTINLRVPDTFKNESEKLATKLKNLIEKNSALSLLISNNLEKLKKLQTPQKTISQIETTLKQCRRLLNTLLREVNAQITTPQQLAELVTIMNNLQELIKPIHPNIKQLEIINWQEFIKKLQTDMITAINYELEISENATNLNTAIQIFAAGVDNEKAILLAQKAVSDNVVKLKQWSAQLSGKKITEQVTNEFKKNMFQFTLTVTQLTKKLKKPAFQPVLAKLNEKITTATNAIATAKNIIISSQTVNDFNTALDDINTLMQQLLQANT